MRNIAENKKTELMAFFEYNRTYKNNRYVLYADFPKSYVFKPELRI